MSPRENAAVRRARLREKLSAELRVAAAALTRSHDRATAANDRVEQFGNTYGGLQLTADPRDLVASLFRKFAELSPALAEQLEARNELDRRVADLVSVWSELEAAEMLDNHLKP
jgi:hypothetical protein